MSIIVIDDYRSKINGIYGKLCHRLYHENFSTPVICYYMYVPGIGRAEIFPHTSEEISSIIQMEYEGDYFYTFQKSLIVDHYVLPKRIEGLKWQ